MFEKMFGGTEEERLKFLRVRSLITIPCGIALVINKELMVVFAFLMMFVWGWGVIKNYFALTSFFALLSQSTFGKVCAFGIYLIVAYMTGIIISFIGCIYYIILEVKNIKGN